MKRGQKSPSSPSIAHQCFARREGWSLLLAGVPGLTAHGIVLAQAGWDSCAWDSTVRCPRKPSALPPYPWDILALPAQGSSSSCGCRDEGWTQGCLFSNLNDSMTQSDSVPAQVAILPSASCAAPSLSHLETPSCLQLCQGRCIAHGRDWDVMIFKVPSNPNHSIILSIIPFLQ